MPDAEIAAAIVHELVHLWQHAYGRPSRPGYHNVQWAGKMEMLGLMPQATGEPTHKKIGQMITQSIIPGGRFESVVREIPSHLFLPLRAKPDDEKKYKDASKTKFVCAKCGDFARGKPTLMIDCRKCKTPFFLEEGEPHAGEAAH